MGEIHFGLELEYLYYKGRNIYKVCRDLNRIMKEGGCPISFSLKDYGDSNYTIWKIVKDCSIYANDDDYELYGELIGFEIISPILTMKDIPLLERFLSILENEMPLLVNDTCGFHIHISQDNQVLNRDSLVKFLKTYLVFEDAIDTLHHDSRIFNVYCDSIRYNKKFREKTMEEIFAEIDKCRTKWGVIWSAHPVFRHRDYKINLQNQWILGWGIGFNFTRKPTIEFRQHIGSFGKNVVLAWLILVVNFFGSYQDVFDEKILLKIEKLGIRRKLEHFFDIYVNDKSVKKHYLLV